MKTIDLSTWKRKEHFKFFYRMDYPQYNICFNVDITKFIRFVKENSLPFYYAMIFVASKAANQVEEFRYRICDGKPIIHSKVHPSFSDMHVDDDLFRFITVDLEDDIKSFCSKAAKESANQEPYFDFTKMTRSDLLYITCIPWISFTHLSHTITLSRDDAVPRISWGKYFNDGGKILLPFSVQVHHALVDGLHLGKYVEVLQNELTNY